MNVNLWNPVELPQNAERAKNVAALLAGNDLILEPKYDGIRLLAHIAEDGVHTYTRTGNSQTGKLPAIEAFLGENFPVGTWLDGEAVVFDDRGAQVWGEAQSVLGSGVQRAASRSQSVRLVVFDVLAYNGLDVRPLPLEQRRRVLDQHLSEDGLVRRAPWLDATDENHERLVAEGFEGSMVKRLDGAYLSGARGRGQSKIKATDEADVIICGFKPGENGFTGLIGAIEFAQIRDGKPVHRGRCSGMDMATRKAISVNPDAYVGRVFACAYMGIMPSGSLRHPQFKAWRDDKPAKDCDWTVS